MKKLEATWLSHALPGTAQIQLAIYYRQAEFLHQIAAVYETTAGITHWWIGLTDMGMYQLTKQICGNTIHKIKKILI